MDAPSRSKNKLEREVLREKLHVSRGLVLRRVKHLEKDVRLTLFLRDIGKVFVVARGAQGMNFRLKSLLELFSETDFQIYLPRHGLYGRVIGGKLLDCHQNLRLNVAAFGVACKSCEVIDFLLPFRAPSSDVYDVLQRCLHGLQAKGDPRIEWLLFVMRLLKVLGHGDISGDIMRLLPPHEEDILRPLLSGEKQKNDPAHPLVLSPSFRRAMGVAHAHLERILPWRLKSDVLNQIIK